MRILMQFRKKRLLLTNYFNINKYMKRFIKFYSKLGVNFEGKGPSWISPDIYIDGFNYKSITIGENVKISREVLILNHDYAVNHLIEALYSEIEKKEKIVFTGDVYIGANTFIGARVTILPGTKIGKNCIIGASSTVKGVIPDNSVVIGNPARVLKKTTDLCEETIEKFISNNNGE